MPRPRHTRHRWWACLIVGLLALGGALTLPGCGGEAKPPVVVIGLDGADYDLLLPWLEAGELPNLKAFLDEALVGELHTVYPILSPVCWTSAITGVNPGKHGIYDFQKEDPDGGPPLIEQATNRRATPIWMLLSEAGYRVGVLNVPMTYPPDPVRGSMVSGFPFPDGDVNIAYPPELHAELGEFPIDFLGESLFKRTPQEMFADMMARLEARGRVSREWIASGDYDFLWLTFTGTDKVQHFFWKFMDREHPGYRAEEAELLGDSILKLWKRQDAILGDMLAALPEDATVMFVSDHGFEGIYRQMNMANWLYDTDLVEWFESHAVPPMMITNGILHYVLQGQMQGAEDRDEFLDKLIGMCRDLRDPETGEAPFEHLFRREDIYEGRMLEKAPDLVFQEMPHWFVTRGDPDSTDLPVFQDIWSTSFSAHHRPEGILAVRGPHVRGADGRSLRERLAAGGDFRKASIVDVTPTLLALLAEMIPDQMDGRVWEEMFRPEFLESTPLRRGPVPGFLLDRSLTPELTPEQKARLQALPYLD